MFFSQEHIIINFGKAIYAKLIPHFLTMVNFPKLTCDMLGSDVDNTRTRILGDVVEVNLIGIPPMVL